METPNYKLDEVKFEQFTSDLNSQDNDFFSNILLKMQALYETKNSDYGNSFEQTMNIFGLDAAYIRMSDKLNRLINLSKKKTEPLNESVKDTLMDLANYAVMTLNWIMKRESND